MLGELERELVAAGDARPRPDPWKLRCARALRELTQAGLGARCGWSGGSNEAISRMEGYALPIGTLRLGKLAKALRLTPAALQSHGDEWHANEERYASWRSDGCPPLRAWLALQVEESTPTGD